MIGRLEDERPRRTALPCQARDHYARASSVTNGETVFTPSSSVSGASQSGCPSCLSISRARSSSVEKWTWMLMSNRISLRKPMTYCDRSARMMSPWSPSYSVFSVKMTGRVRICHVPFASDSTGIAEPPVPTAIESESSCGIADT